MGALKSRDFIYKGLQFHLNDAKYHNEFTPKYLLMQNRKKSFWVLESLFRESLIRSRNW